MVNEKVREVRDKHIRLLHLIIPRRNLCGYSHYPELQALQQERQATGDL